MYQRATEDLDGHTWEFVYLDAAAIQRSDAFGKERGAALSVSRADPFTDALR